MNISDLIMYSGHLGNTQKIYSKSSQLLHSLVNATFMTVIIVVLTLISEHIIHIDVTQATSINQGISQQPITDMTLLMPKLCQNQSVICEGSFCIPGIRRCVCDLRMPVQFDKFCLKQVDIQTKCFVTSQCNHTVKDSVCIDLNSNAILDVESSRFKLDQWQQLNELRQLSQQSIPNSQGPSLGSKQTRETIESTGSNMLSGFTFEEDLNNVPLVDLRDGIVSAVHRNSPYEINYNTPELLHQNHTRRRTNFMLETSTTKSVHDLSNHQSNQIPKSSSIQEESQTTTQQPVVTQDITMTKSTDKKNDDSTTATTKISSISVSPITETPNSNSPTTGFSRSQPVQQTTSVSIISSVSPPSIDLSNRKMVTKSANWPPGICSCPFGFMFDSMLRKCLALSLIDSHCTTDPDCKQIQSTHCLKETKKCVCDEPLVWNSKELACMRTPGLLNSKNNIIAPKNQDESPDTSNTIDTSFLLPSTTGSLLDYASISLVLFLIFVIIGSLIIMELSVKCFSGSNSSALISPRRQQQHNEQKKHKQQTQSSLDGTLTMSRSPYATLRRPPDHTPNSQSSNFTQATRGRILNYDFEQDSMKTEPLNNQQSTISNNVSNAMKITFLFLI